MAHPEKTFRIGGCSASVFVNDVGQGANQRTFRSVALQRRYKDGDEWKSSSSFPLSDLPAAITVLQLALDYIAPLEA